MINETDQRLEIPETNPHIYGQLIFEEGAKKTQWKKESLQLMMLRKLNIPMKVLGGCIKEIVLKKRFFTLSLAF